MTSREIYSVTAYLSNNLKWDNDYIYCGIGEDFKSDFTCELLTNFLSGEMWYFVDGRRDSSRLGWVEIFESIRAILGMRDFMVWNDELDKAVKFCSIGVLFKGVKTVHVKNALT